MDEFEDLCKIYEELNRRFAALEESEERYRTLAQQLEQEVQERNRRLRESEAKYKTLVESAGDAIFTVDQEGNCVSMNRIAAQLIGGNPTDFVGKNIYELFSKKEAELYMAYIQKVFRTGEGAIHEYPYRIFSKEFWFNTSLDPIRDETGQVIYVLGVSRDVTKRKRIEKEKEVISNVNKIIASSLDIKDVYKAISAELKKILDFDRMAVSLLDEGQPGGTEPSGFRIYALIKYYENSEEDDLVEGTFVPKAGTYIGEAVDTGKPILVKDIAQSPYWGKEKLLREGIHSSLIYPLIYRGEVLGTITFSSKKVDNFSEDQLDLIKHIAPQLAIAIENTRLFNRIKQSEERFRSFLENTKDFIIYIVSPDGSSIYFNPVVEQILGYKPEDYYRNKDLWVSQIHPEDRALVFEAQRRVFKGKGKSLEFRMIHRNKRDVRWLYSSATVLKNDRGEGASLAGYAIDITERKRLEELVRRSERLASIGELAAGLAHEIRNPLLAISNSAKLLKRDADLHAEDRELMKIIVEEADRLNKIVTNFLQFARPREPVFLENDIREIIEEVLRLLKKDTRWNDRIKILVSCEPELPKVHLDADQMREVFWNLFINALEAMPDEGTIKVEVLAIRTKDPHSLQVKISDTGVGIAPERVTKIFEPFHTSKPQGSGLGLSIAHRIVEEHSGFLEVESEIGKGATFTVTLPLSAEVN